MEFTQTLVFDFLLIFQLIGDFLEDAWKRLNTYPTYDPPWLKATILCSPAFRYIRFILSHTMTGHSRSTDVVILRDFNFLVSMLNRFKLHLGYKVTISISHQETDPHIGSYLSVTRSCDSLTACASLMG